ncbi:GNAT family N-acetyltransferase [Microbacterium sp.]|uniref:GNAT family N-acetyltransferase n=1 Tax=Microbacterium sp. TaxID=51671 RepID=UPI000928080C|nr:GNAT family N-acetyltransferase [Microbacterium sp.]OJU57836.1 MAG: GNAT family N-acetyltransferase [Microbacterium sp. 70-38]MBN9168865.1 GNAT family N-acetyltransferase [Microbacterium sp.]MBN9186092.1 GNAT family N-acetyltransferase [Microbacterium sp.]MBN9190122.1 GNAT family N-acetyltransferase [Microbacterium sp.]MBN9191575.1 GNAT family N-acetyltransferase [Microbacterium sp.]
MVSIDPLNAADRDDWLPLWHAYLVFYESALPDAVTDDVFARIVANDGLHGAIARDDAGHPLGFVHWLVHPSTWSTDGYCYLEDLFVSPGARGGGVGAALIAHVRDWADAAGCEKVYWLTQSANTTARALYDRVAQSTGFVHYEMPLRGV